MLLFIQLYAILFYLAIGNASLMLFNKLTYITLGHERNFIFKHVIRVSFLRELEVSWSWNTLLRG